ncbi:MAG: hypothetical protein ACK4N5_00950 [Myxococcales bacterium]
MPRPPSRWDFIQDLKPIELKQHFLNEAAKLLAKDLEKWPLTIEAWENPQAEARFARLTLPGAPRPDERVYEAAFKLARWEMEREFEAIDEFMRNERWRAYGADEYGRDAMLLLNRWMIEQLLSILEVTEGRINRALLVELVDRTERELRRLRSPLYTH